MECGNEPGLLTGSNPIGQVIVIGKGLGPQFEESPRQITGVVGNVRENGLNNKGVGVMSYSVQQRTQKIGIRLGLGATRGRILKLVLAQGMKLAGIGVGLGLALAYGATRLLASLLFGVKASDPLTFGAIAGILTEVALVPAYIP